MNEKEGKGRVYTPVPLGISRVSSFFGNIIPSSLDFEVPYIKVKREFDQATLFFFAPKEHLSSTEEGISKSIFEGISKILCDPLQHKMVFAPFAFADYQTGHYWFDPNDFCDLLGYRRSDRGSHVSKNKRAVEACHANLTKIEIEIPVVRGRKKLVYKGTLIHPEGERIEGYVDDALILKRGKFRILSSLWEDVKDHGYYAPLDERAYRIDLDSYPWGFKLYTASVLEGRRLWNKGVRNRGAFTVDLKKFLSLAGVNMDMYRKNPTRKLERLRKDLDYLTSCHTQGERCIGGREGLIEDYKLEILNIGSLGGWIQIRLTQGVLERLQGVIEGNSPLQLQPKDCTSIVKTLVSSCLK